MLYPCYNHQILVLTHRWLHKKNIQPGARPESPGLEAPRHGDLPTEGAGSTAGTPQRNTAPDAVQLPCKWLNSLFFLMVDISPGNLTYVSKITVRNGKNSLFKDHFQWLCEIAGGYGRIQRVF